MYMYICICICMHVCAVYVRCMYVYMQAYMYVCVQNIVVHVGRIIVMTDMCRWYEFKYVQCPPEVLTLE